VNTKNVILGVIALAIVWCLLKPKTKRATEPSKYDETETILAGQGAIYPLDTPSLDGTVGTYA